jgi:hypothetical protein
MKAKPLFFLVPPTRIERVTLPLGVGEFYGFPSISINTKNRHEPSIYKASRRIQAFFEIDRN